MREDWILDEGREYAWEYFKAHAEQRMSLFNFFVVFSSLVTVGLAGTFQEEIQAHVVGVGLGVLLMLISFVFWKLDKRVGFLIKHSEAALKWIEGRFPVESQEGEAHALQLFTREEARTKDEQKVAWWNPWRRHLTYSKCFGLAFLGFGTIGLVGIVASLAVWGGQTGAACQ